MFFKLEISKTDSKISSAISSPMSRWHYCTDLASLLAVPVLFAVTNGAWIYSPVGWVDPWNYVGYGLNYNNASFMDAYYKISRLPWVLIEFTVRQTFDVVTSSWILQIGLLWTTIVGFYFTFLRTFGRYSAFFGTLFFAIDTFAYASGGADYHNGCSGAFYVLCWLALTWCADGAFSVPRLLAAGALGALTVHNNILFVNFLPILFAYYVVAYRNAHDSWPPFIRSIAFLTAGAILATLALCAVNLAVGRNPWFFLPQFRLAASFVANDALQKPWWHSWQSGWYRSALYLVPFAAGYVASILAFLATLLKVIKVADPHLKRMVLVYTGAYIFAGSLWLLWQTIGQTALEPDYFAYPLILPFVGAVTAISGLNAARKAWINSAVACIATAILFVAPYVFWQSQFQFLHGSHSIILGFIFVTLGAIMLAIIPKAYVIPASCAVLSLGMCASSHNYSNFDWRDACPRARLGETAVDEAHRILRRQGYPFDKIFLWSDQDETISVGHGCSGGAAIMALGEFTPSLISTGFDYLQPRWKARSLSQLQDKRLADVARRGALVGYITNDPQRVAKLEKRFAEDRGAVVLKSVRAIKLSALPITMYLWEVRAKDKRR